jgi:hypothetical protein
VGARSNRLQVHLHDRAAAGVPLRAQDLENPLGASIRVFLEKRANAALEWVEL